MVTFIAHHGTSLKNAKNIERSGFIDRVGKVGWLGTGAYFFLNNYELAYGWARYRYPHEKNVVIKYDIVVSEDSIFDLRDPDGDDSKRFHSMRREMLSTAKKERISIVAKNKKDLDGKLINKICAKYNYLLVIANTYTYNEDDREFQLESRFPNGTELCLRYNNKNCSEYIYNRELIQEVI